MSHEDRKSVDFKRSEKIVLEGMDTNELDDGPQPELAREVIECSFTAEDYSEEEASEANLSETDVVAKVSIELAPAATVPPEISVPSVAATKEPEIVVHIEAIEETKKPPVSLPRRFLNRVVHTFVKFAGAHQERPPRERAYQIFISGLGSFLSILFVALINVYVSTPAYLNLPFLLMSFGASAVLLFGFPKSPLAQPRNFIGSNLIASIVGICLRNLFEVIGVPWLALPFSMGISLSLMQITETAHPPGTPSFLSSSSSLFVSAFVGLWFVVAARPHEKLFGISAMIPTYLRLPVSAVLTSRV